MTPVRPSSLGEVPLPREVVLASAGTGKTFTLSSRLITLLALGAPPDTLLASTFTRKAAGEILGRVLSRLAGAAVDDEKAKKLAEETGLSSVPAEKHPSTREAFSSLLRSLVRELHRTNVGTLDSLFVRMAGSFSVDLGMPPDWTISDEPTALRMESEALQEVLSGAAPRVMAELIRMTMRGESGRGVHQRLLAQLNELRALLHQQGLSDPEAVWRPAEPALSSGGGKGDGAPPWANILMELGEAPLPETAGGEPDGRFRDAVAGSIEALEKGDWAAFCGKGLGAKILAGEDHFHRKPIPTPLREAYQRALAGVSRALRTEVAAQTRALRTLVLAFDGALEEIHRREGAYRFEDVTFLLAGEDPLATRTDLWYRMDQKAHHLLLDEFQDTSRAQWEALEPLASEILSGHPEERSALVVADPKQSIYGWRGAEPSLARRIGARFGMEGRSLDLSYRSSGPVLDLVNTVFKDLPSNPVWGMEPGLMAAAEEWSAAFPMHRPALDRPGFVSLEAGPREDGNRSSDRPALMAWAAERIRDLRGEYPDAEIGVLVRRNAAVARLMNHLRSMGVDASEEGSTTLTDSPAVSTALSLLRLADHPGDRVALYQVVHSPLGSIVGLTDQNDPGKARQVALSLRRELLAHGYGPVLGRWAGKLFREVGVGGRESARLSQLVELAYRWDARSTLRPRDFVRFAEHQAMEAPSDARVRVMTVHKAKGLEFDVVVLPEMDLRLTRGQGLYQAVLPLRDRESGKVLRIFPKLNQAFRPLFPEIDEAGQQDREGELHDALGVAYVALTRARHALFLFMESDPPNRKPKVSFSFAGLVRGALGLEGTVAQEGMTLFQAGNREWCPRVLPTREEREPDSVRLPPASDLPVRTAGRRTRSLPHLSPSGLKDTGPESISRILSLGGGAGRRIGTIVHAWLEDLIWLEDWQPDLETLHLLGSRDVPDLSRAEAEALLGTLQGWLAREEIRARLRKASYPEGSRVLNEEPFAVQLDGRLYQGRLDRLVLHGGPGGGAGAEILDYKTDRLAPGDEEGLNRLTSEYSGQLEIYRRAVAQLFGIERSLVGATLVFLMPGRTVEVPAGG